MRVLNRYRKQCYVAVRPSPATCVSADTGCWLNVAAMCEVVFPDLMRNKWMINELRFFLAVMLFCLGIYLVWDLFVAGFDFIVLLSSLFCFVAAHYIKPKSDDGDDSSVVFDILDFIVDIPFRAISIFLRAISKPFKGDADGFDL